MSKRFGAAVTIAAVCVLSAMCLVGCSWGDVAEKFVGADGSAVSGGSASGGAVDIGDLPVYVSGQAVEIEPYDVNEIVTLSEYKGVEVDCTVQDSELQEGIDDLIEQHPKQVKTGTAKTGMTVNIDYKGKLNGKAFDGGSAEGTSITLGESGMIPGFDDGIIGMKVGETKDVELTFPEEYPNNEDLAGKKTVFTMKLNYIEEKAEFDDAFVKENTDYKTVDEYKAAKRSELAETKKSAKATTALQKIVSESKVSKVPPTLLVAEREMIRSQMQAQMAQYGMTMDQAMEMQGMTADQFEQNLIGQAQSMAESELIMEAIAVKENIDISDKAVDDYIQQMVSGSKDEEGNSITIDKVKENYTSFYGTAMKFERYMRSSLIYTKVSELVGNAAKIIE
ncbi:MAG TPA: trigger factor [Lachnospiraceae bacterium]|nr:trigger factor [Lachnospiraceae bacterium]